MSSTDQRTCLPIAITTEHQLPLLWPVLRRWPQPARDPPLAAEHDLLHLLLPAGPLGPLGGRYVFWRSEIEGRHRWLFVGGHR